MLLSDISEFVYFDENEISVSPRRLVIMQLTDYICCSFIKSRTGEDIGYLQDQYCFKTHGIMEAIYEALIDIIDFL